MVLALISMSQVFIPCSSYTHIDKCESSRVAIAMCTHPSYMPKCENFYILILGPKRTWITRVRTFVS